MNRYYIISEDINTEVVSDIIEILGYNDFDKLSIYCNTKGGYSESTAVLLDIINQYKDRIELVATEYLISNGFLLFAQAEVPIRFLNTFVGILIHKSYITVNTNAFLDISSNDHLFIKNLESYNRVHEDILKKVLPKDKFIKYKEGGDVVFIGEEAKQIINETRKKFSETTIKHKKSVQKNNKES